MGTPQMWHISVTDPETFPTMGPEVPIWTSERAPATLGEKDEQAGTAQSIASSTLPLP